MFKRNFGSCVRSVKHHQLLLIRRRPTSHDYQVLCPCFSSPKESDDGHDSGWPNDENESPTQGVYRFDKTLYEAVCTTPVSGEIPTELLYRLPESAVYFETPEMKWNGETVYGVFATVSDDAWRHEI